MAILARIEFGSQGESKNFPQRRPTDSFNMMVTGEQFQFLERLADQAKKNATRNDTLIFVTDMGGAIK